MMSTGAQTVHHAHTQYERNDYRVAIFVKFTQKPFPKVTTTAVVNSNWKIAAIFLQQATATVRRALRSCHCTARKKKRKISTKIKKRTKTSREIFGDICASFARVRPNEYWKNERKRDTRARRRSRCRRRTVRR